MRFSVIFAGIVSIILCGCRGSGKADSKIVLNGDTITSEAKYLRMVDCGEWTAVEITVPWNDSIPTGRYAIIHPETDRVDLPGGFTPIHAPVGRAVVFSSIYTAAIEELGRINSVKGVADAEYIPGEDSVAILLKEGKVADIGSSMAPLVEKVIDLEPDAVLLSPYAGVGSTGLERTGIPLIWMADYLETSPLGRSEWILLLGELFGENEKAQNIYKNSKETYNRIQKSASTGDYLPKVITEKPMSGVWYVPGGKSYIAKMIQDAGGSYVWADKDESGSISLDEAAVIDRGVDADIWLIKDIKPITASGLLKELPRAKGLAPYPEKVYACNTIETPYYRAIAFHPEIVLADIAAIFHPSLFPNHQFKFYRNINDE